MIEEDSLQDTWSSSPLQTPFRKFLHTMEDTSGPEKNSVDLERTRASSWVVKGDQSVKVITWYHVSILCFLQLNLSESIIIWISSESIFLLKGALRCCHCGLGMWMFLILPTRHQHFLHSLEEDANSTASFLSPNQVHFLGQMVKTCKNRFVCHFLPVWNFFWNVRLLAPICLARLQFLSQKLDRFFYDLRFWNIGARTSCHTMQTEKPDEIGGPHSGQGGPDCAPSPSNLHRCNGIGLAVWHLRAETVSLPAWASLRRELQNASNKWPSICNSQICSRSVPSWYCIGWGQTPALRERQSAPCTSGNNSKHVR